MLLCALFSESRARSLENALQADSGLTGELKIPLQVCHLKLGDKYFQEKNYEKAVVHYESYLKLAPARVELDNDKYNEAYYQLGKLEYSRGNLEKARESLLRVRYALRKRPELHYLLGSILAREKNYSGALGYLNSALKLKGNSVKILYKRGLCRLAVARQLEDELSELLEVEDESLKGGKDFVDAIAVIINETEAKGIQLELQARPKVLKGRTQLTPQQIEAKMLVNTEREKHLAKMRAEIAKLKNNFQQNKSRQVEIITKLKRIYESMILGGNDLERAVVLKEGDSHFREIINLLRKKNQFFNRGKSRLEIGLNQEKFIEKRAFSALRLSLRTFGSEKSVSGAVKGIKMVYDSLSMSQVGDNLREGWELWKKAKAIEIPIEEYLSKEAIP